MVVAAAASLAALIAAPMRATSEAADAIMSGSATRNDIPATTTLPCPFGRHRRRPRWLDGS
ncbi:hypothetical protein BZL29_2971 [Mycobacterium kansasii]|uniref:Uncharacterized protein n=1 Tax=Mycobacterium kansasii TaxID=1768 RepID=A0A1V3XCK5_MYCKA|nr:hypothetical protein BZL29_2971 [Mycobacterium kansasii]